MSSAKRRSTSGFSLIEALAAATVLGGGLLMLTSAAIQLTRDEKHVDWTNAAHGLVQHTLEDLRSMPLGAAAVNPGTYTDANTLKADGTTGGPFTRSWTVSANDVPTFGLRTVTVRVTWRDSLKDVNGIHTTTAAGYVRCPNIPC
jgi:Tfp pilus assembly protein PilV